MIECRSLKSHGFCKEPGPATTQSYILFRKLHHFSRPRGLTKFMNPSLSLIHCCVSYTYTCKLNSHSQCQTSQVCAVDFYAVISVVDIHLNAVELVVVYFNLTFSLVSQKFQFVFYQPMHEIVLCILVCICALL